MKRFFKSAVMAVLVLLVTGMVSRIQAQYKKLLIVSTNIDSLQGDLNGTFLMEIAYPVAVWQRLGIEVDVLTPKGGKAAVYHRGKRDSSLARIEESDYFKKKIGHSLTPGEINPADYAGIFYPGGGGQFYDVVNNHSIAKIAAAIYEHGGVIGAAGHGPVSLLNIRLNDGIYLVKGKRITCFPKSISAKWLPIDWEDGLKQRGATVVLPVSPEEKENGVQLIEANARVITGSYAENAAWVAEQMAVYLKG
ncbi:MAG: type 1 glutamine amidotransferase domain-containing protein [Chitinophagaceae bacterium]|nr:type 1 glutamine amidotransferase domain-containing protein [Chitinophagaceae bacterium]